MKLVPIYQFVPEKINLVQWSGSEDARHQDVFWGADDEAWLQKHSNVMFPAKSLEKKEFPIKKRNSQHLKTPSNENQVFNSPNILNAKQHYEWGKE